MNLINRKFGSAAVADSTAFAKLSRVGQRVRCGRNIQVAARACRRNRLNRIDWVLWIRDRSEAQRQIDLAPIHMAHGAVPCVSGRSGWAHRGITDIAEIVMAAAEADDDIRAVLAQILPRVNTMDQEIEIDPLRRRRLVSRVLRVYADRSICV